MLELGFQSLNLPLQRGALKLVLPNARQQPLVEPLLIVIETLGHLPHDAGLALARRGNQHDVQVQRLEVAWRALHEILPLKANRQHAQCDDASHVHGGLAVLRHGLCVGREWSRQAPYGKGGQGGGTLRQWDQGRK